MPFFCSFFNASISAHYSAFISYTLREGNACADFLAKFGSCNDMKLKIWITPNERMGELLKSDSQRTQHPNFLFFFALFLFLFSLSGICTNKNKKVCGVGKLMFH
jgi:hypothetical protein